VSIGEVLAAARRRAGLSVAEVSEQTRIGETVILGIEDDDYSACGGDFDVRGHIRVLAAAVEADPGPLIAAYDSAHLGGPALAGEVTEPLPPVRVPPGRSEPTTPARVSQRRLPAGPVTPAATGGRRRRPALVVALGVVLVAGLGVAGYLLADPGGGGAPPAAAPTATASQAGRATRATSAPSATGSAQAAPASAATSAGARPRRLTPVSATAFGPAGGPGDNSDLARLAIDGNPATAWHTDWYSTARFGNLYPGTGLLVDMGHPATLTGAAIRLGRAHGASFQLRAGATPALASLRPVARASGAGGVVRLQFTRPVRGRYLLLWFTRLPPGPAGNFQASVYRLVPMGRT
jgi:helix-turn-helix protein